jgi:hypothetical protein
MDFSITSLLSVSAKAFGIATFRPCDLTSSYGIKIESNVTISKQRKMFF